jgi:acyl CoA:acetate/3-ketoacid CoA transferase alpha subunit
VCIVANSEERLQRQIRKLPLEQKLALQDWLAEAIAADQQQLEAIEIPVLLGREVVESDTPSEAGGLMNVTAPRAGKLH